MKKLLFSILALTALVAASLRAGTETYKQVAPPPPPPLYGVGLATEWQRIGNQIDAAMIFAWSDFVKVHRPASDLILARWYDVTLPPSISRFARQTCR